MSRARRCGAAAREASRGSIAPFVVIVAAAFFALGGLVIDGARQLDAHARAVAYAQEAARAGAQRIVLTSGDVELDVAEATEAVDEYCAAATELDASLVECSPASFDPDSSGTDVAGLTVSTRVEVDGIVFDRTLAASAESGSNPLQGIEDDDVDVELPDPATAYRNLDPPFGVDDGPVDEEIEIPAPVPPCEQPDPPPSCDDGGGGGGNGDGGGNGGGGNGGGGNGGGGGDGGGGNGGGGNGGGGNGDGGGNGG